MDKALKDNWIQFAIAMSREFLCFIQSTPSAKYEVWRQDELDYFCFAFTLWTSKNKFKLNSNTKEQFKNRTDAYLINLSNYINLGNQVPEVNYKLDYDYFLNRYNMYSKLFDSGTNNIFRMFSLSTFVPAVESFLENACVESMLLRKVLIKDISKWVNSKGVEFDQTASFYFGG